MIHPTILTAVCAFALGAVSFVAAAESEPAAGVDAAAARPAAPVAWSDRAKHPLPWLTWGADLRIREEIFDNALTLDPDNALHRQNTLRLRSRVWLNAAPLEDLSLNLRIANESRLWFEPAGYTPFQGQTGADGRDGVFDTVNVQWRRVAGLPLTLTVGRQDIQLGDGWLVSDGTPYDGSWTFAFDALRLSLDLATHHTSLDLIGILQDAHDDAWLPTLNAHQHLVEMEQNEQGAVLWLRNTSLPHAHVDAWYIYKHDDAFLAFGTPAARAYRPDNGDIHAFGGRLSGDLDGHWRYAVEAALQRGRKQDPSIAWPAATLAWHDLAAYGVNGLLGYAFGDARHTHVDLAAELLSGDNPRTRDDEMFDNLWGRWPRWSEIGAYNFAAETRFGDEANLLRVGPKVGFEPVADVEFSAAWYALLAPHAVATRASPALIDGTGTFRGQLLQAVLRYHLDRHVSAHLWAEVEVPGDYYVHRQAWFFLRPEIMLTF